ncbi:MAG: type I restriction enzyme HsdR N-terminal domain-containing protein [Thermodesulfobacteriota bacterium]
MDNFSKPYQMITDFVTEKPVPDVGAEANRQAVERYLVNEKGYRRNDISVDMDLDLEVAGNRYKTRLDLVVFVDGTAAMVIKCAAGSLDSREKEVIAAARVAAGRPMPYAAASDGQTALVYDAVNRKKCGQGLASLPSPEALRQKLAQDRPAAISPGRLEKEKLIFRSYDLMNINVGRNIADGKNPD